MLWDGLTYTGSICPVESCNGVSARLDRLGSTRAVIPTGWLCQLYPELGVVSKLPVLAIIHSYTLGCSIGSETSLDRGFEGMYGLTAVRWEQKARAEMRIVERKSLARRIVCQSLLWNERVNKQSELPTEYTIYFIRSTNSTWMWEKPMSIFYHLTLHSAKAKIFSCRSR